jgi:Holliday junction resolvase RusA-like endonuclease
MNPDMDRLTDLLVAVGANASGRIDKVIVPGPPQATKRPRVGRSGVVYSPSSVDENALATWFLGIRRYERNVALVAVFYRPNRQRIDVDNLLKFVMDAATKAGVWKDDSQVTCVLGRVEFDADQPRTLIGFAEDTSSMTRAVPTRLCGYCGKQFELEWAGAKDRFCSPRCRGRSLRQEKVHPGRGRGPKGQPPTACADCGRPLSKRSYIRCRSCWASARGLGVS